LDTNVIGSWKQSQQSIPILVWMHKPLNCEFGQDTMMYMYAALVSITFTYNVMFFEKHCNKILK
jgi:tryptophan-rich sensory protein